MSLELPITTEITTTKQVVEEATITRPFGVFHNLQGSKAIVILEHGDMVDGEFARKKVSCYKISGEFYGRLIAPLAKAYTTAVVEGVQKILTCPDSDTAKTNGEIEELVHDVVRGNFIVLPLD